MNNIAFVFPGQGSQSVGMQQALAEHYPLIKEIYQEASDALHFNLWDLVANGPAELLNQTQYTQPALLTAGVCAWSIWKEQNKPTPHYLAGHSLGEYTALVCANALSFTDAVVLVSKRGQFMQQSVPEGIGAMAAIVGIDESAVREACSEAEKIEGLSVSPANLNALGQTVIAGHKKAVECAMEIAQTKGAKLIKILPVSVPAHCALMQDAAAQLEEELTNIHITAPRIPVIQNYDVQSHSDAAAIKNALVKQMVSPVRWVETIQWLAKNHINTIYECGPGNVLVGLIKRTEKDIKTVSLNTPEGYNLTVSA